MSKVCTAEPLCMSLSRGAVAQAHPYSSANVRIRLGLIERQKSSDFEISPRIRNLIFEIDL